MTPQRRLSWPFAVGLGLACLALAYGAVSETAAGLLSDSDPDLAVAVRPGDSQAEIAAAEQAVGEALTDSEIKAAMDRSRSALRSAPASTPALRTLAQGYQLAGDTKRASQLMARAGERSLRDTTVQLWLFREAMDARRYPEAYLRADLMMRRRPDLAPALFPAMLAAFDQPEARSALLTRLRLGPSWRTSFLRQQSESSDAAGVALWLVTNLTSSPNPPTQAELGLVAGGLARAGRWTQVRQLWGSFGSKALLYDGDFEASGREPPFSWRVQVNDGDLASIEQVDNGHALFAQFRAGRNAALAEILLVLSPGDYRLTGMTKIDENPSAGLFRWNLTCATTGAPIASHDESQTGGWRRFETAFAVPASGCEAQWLRLSGTGGEGYVPTRAWFDNLRIEATAAR